MSDADAVAVAPVIDALVALSVRHHIGGSVASSVHGIPRTTLDVDLVADLSVADAGPLVRSLEDAYYVDEDTVLDAIRRRASFNALHLETMYKVDVFVMKARRYDRQAIDRTEMRALTEGGRLFPVATAEDVVLNKLEWFRKGGEASERRWRDVVYVLSVQAGHLDERYLAVWAEDLGIADLLERAQATVR